MYNDMLNQYFYVAPRLKYWIYQDNYSVVVQYPVIVNTHQSVFAK